MGARTGRDGIGGASVLASAELDEDDASKRPSVQIGDPFEEKKLLECCLELLERGTLRSLQDLGAAGLSSSSSEMASKGQVGLDLDVSRVPLREDDMEPFEIMVSESQERMLCVVEPGRLSELEEVCGRWEVRATAIGEVTDTRRLRVLDGEEVVGDMPVGALVDDCPLYDLEPERPAQQVYPAPERQLGSDDARESLLALMASPNLASRRPLFEQYDSIVGSRTVRRPEQADAAVLQLAPDGGSGGIAVAIDGNGRRVACDPYTGTVEAVLECASNLACVGAEPLGLTNCLNFGNPEKPHVAWQLERSVAGMADALRALEVPGGGRQRVPLQRVRRRPDLPHAGGGHGRQAARRASARHRSRFARGGPRRGGLRRAPAPPPRRRSWQSCAARSCPPSCRPWTWPRSVRPRRPCATPSAPGSWPAPTTSPAGAFSWRSPRAAWRAGSARRWTSGPATPLLHLFGEGPGGLRGLGPARGPRAPGTAHAAGRRRHRRRRRAGRHRRRRAARRSRSPS